MAVSGWKTQAGMYSRPHSGLLSYLRSHSFHSLLIQSRETDLSGRKSVAPTR